MQTTYYEIQYIDAYGDYCYAPEDKYNKWSLQSAIKYYNYIKANLSSNVKLYIITLNSQELTEDQFPTY